MSASRRPSPQEQAVLARDIDRASTVLISAGVNTIKRNPIKVGSYLLGILLCLFFNGWKVTDQQRTMYEEQYNKVNYRELDRLSSDLYIATDNYYRTKGWFTCDPTCKDFKDKMDNLQIEFNAARAKEQKKLASAKSVLGLFSEYGVAETRDLFWERFTQGKGFATRQSKWDALFVGISSMGRDETFLSYLLRLLIRVLFNFTIGVIGAVVAFMFSLYSVIQSYDASFLVGTIFFTLASLAAVSFAATWIIGMYFAAAGSVYVGAKLIAANMRIEDGGGRSHRRID